MPNAAMGSGGSQVQSLTGSGSNCAFPIMTSTDICSSKVTIEGKGAVRVGDKVSVHASLGCLPDISTLTVGSSKVTVEGLPVGRVGDLYTSDNIIITGSSQVIIGG
jgi:uncharacterized Zn-binding protein involved in type VI secretion